MMTHRSPALVDLRVLILLPVVAGCGGDAKPSETVGRVSAALTLPASPEDVVAIDFKVVGATADCDATAIASRLVTIEMEALPASLLPAGSGGMHAFSDALFVLDPGNYRVCATPMAQEGPSQRCHRADGLAEVIALTTTEIVLVSQCDGKPTGGLDAVVALNEPPRITGLDISPSKFPLTCEEASLTVAATDPNGDSLTYEWMVVSGPGATTLTAAGAAAKLSATTAGDYVVKVTVRDNLGGATSMMFPIHVSLGTDANGNGLGDECENGPGVTFRAQFTQGQSPNSCGAWQSFVAGLGPSYGSVKLSGTFDPPGVACNDPSIVNQIATALRTSGSGGWNCNGHFWTVCSQYYGPSIFLDAPSVCSGLDCPNPGFLVRPCIANSNFGGIQTATCGPPSQEMVVSFQ